MEWLFFFFLKTFDWLWANPAFVCFAADNEVTQLVHIFLTSQVHRLTRFTRKVKKELDSSFSHATHIIIWIWDKAYCMAAWHLWTLVLVLILLLARIGIHSIDCAEYGQRNTNDEVLFDTSLYASVSVAHEHKFAPVLDYGTILWSTWRKLARKKLLDSKLSHGAVPQHADTGCQSVVSKITDNRTAFEPGFLIKPKSWNMSGKKNWKTNNASESALNVIETLFCSVPGWVCVPTSGVEEQKIGFALSKWAMPDFSIHISLSGNNQLTIYWCKGGNRTVCCCLDNECGFPLFWSFDCFLELLFCVLLQRRSTNHN